MQRSTWISLGLAACIIAPLIAACGGDDEFGSPTATGSTATGTAGTGGSGTGGGGQGGATNTGSGTGTATGTATGTGSGSGGAACATWLVTYDLTGSTYFIDATVDYTITVQTPYDENRNMGPGTMVLRFEDDGGAPADGPVTIVDYSLRQNFVTGITGALVTTDIMTTAGPDPCGVATGTLTAGALQWNPAVASPYCRDGQVSCAGFLCGNFGSPPENSPFVFDDDCTEPLPLSSFVFDGGVSSFTMESVTMSQDGNQSTHLAFVGTETDRQLDPATPGCACP
ncbi:MAG: hypothetical protein JRI23_22745 [Deltaproteobacteria bacterium]|jgi:hypothetical protein|nr:hypothetical protein [Deltaproteobacteria bacterium]MBW2534787.1 hypothetical protein [Deltaproteobacteria bacterium]